jgi:hypothetical protein
LARGGAAPMHVQLCNVLACEGAGRLEADQQPAVERLSGARVD